MSINSVQANLAQVRSTTEANKIDVKASSQFQNSSVSIIANTAQNHLNALEELTKALGDKASAQFTQSKAKDVRQSNAERVEKVQQLMEMAFKVEQRNQLDELAADLMSDGKADQQTLRQKLQDFSDDITDQYLGLLTLREQLSLSSGNEAILQLINAQLSEFERKYGDTLTIGINTLGPIMEAEGAGLGDRSTLRQLYADSVMDYQGPADAFADLLEKYGESRFESAILFMLQALAADYAAKGSSIDKPQLSIIMKDMNRLKMLGAIYDQCKDAVAIINHEPLSARELMQSILQLSELPWAEQADVERQFDAYQLPSQSHINLLTQTRTIMNNIPHEAYRDPEQHGQCVAMIEKALNSAIEGEYA